MKITSVSRIEESVLAQLDQQQERVVNLLTNLLKYKTVTPRDSQQAEGEDYRQLIQYISSFLVEIGVDQQDIWEQDSAKLDSSSGLGSSPDRDLSRMPILAATLSGAGGGKSLILNGHYDVVPAGDASAWTHDPFTAKVTGTKVYGRGSCDMKGGIAAMLLALRTLRELDVHLKGDLIVQVVPDEEMTCMGTLACCQRGYTAEAALIPEPTDMQVLIAMRGSFYGQIVVRGRAGHTEMPQPDWQEGGAVNAISKAQIVLAALDALNQQWQAAPDQQHALLDPDSIVATSISTGSDWAVTIPDQVTISFGVMTTSTMEIVHQQIESFVGEYIQTDSWLRENPPEFLYEPVWHGGAEISEEEPIVLLGQEVLGQLGYSPKVCGMGSLTDAVHLINYSKIPTISIGPAGQSAHMVDEYVEISQLIDLAKAVALVMMRWCGVEEGK